jgi:Concanavalin A-like lectin/glucanases superfamily
MCSASPAVVTGGPSKSNALYVRAKKLRSQELSDCYVSVYRADTSLFSNPASGPPTGSRRKTARPAWRCRRWPRRRSAWGRTSTAEHPLDQDEWHYICATFDGAWVRLFVDGAFDSATVISGAPRPVSAPWRIGAGLQGIVRAVRVFVVASVGSEPLDARPLARELDEALQKHLHALAEP